MTQASLLAMTAVEPDTGGPGLLPTPGAGDVCPVHPL